MNISGKKIIIFGGTSGIGKSTTEMLSNKGASEIIAISRDPERIGNVPKKCKVRKIRCFR